MRTDLSVVNTYNNHNYFKYAGMAQAINAAMKGHTVSSLPDNFGEKKIWRIGCIIRNIWSKIRRLSSKYNEKFERAAKQVEESYNASVSKADHVGKAKLGGEVSLDDLNFTPTQEREKLEARKGALQSKIDGLEKYAEYKSNQAALERLRSEVKELETGISEAEGAIEEILTKYNLAKEDAQVTIPLTIQRNRNLEKNLDSDQLPEAIAKLRDEISGLQKKFSSVRALQNYVAKNKDPLKKALIQTKVGRSELVGACLASDPSFAQTTGSDARAWKDKEPDVNMLAKLNTVITDYENQIKTKEGGLKGAIQAERDRLSQENAVWQEVSRDLSFLQKSIEDTTLILNAKRNVSKNLEALISKSGADVFLQARDDEASLEQQLTTARSDLASVEQKLGEFQLLPQESVTGLLAGDGSPGVPEAVEEVVTQEPVEKPSSTPVGVQGRALADIEGYGCAELKTLMETLFTQLGEDIIDSWSCDDQGKFTLKAKEPVQMYYRPTEDNGKLKKETPRGVILQFCNNEQKTFSGTLNKQTKSIDVTQGIALRAEVDVKVGYRKMESNFTKIAYDSKKTSVTNTVNVTFDKAVAFKKTYGGQKDTTSLANMIKYWKTAIRLGKDQDPMVYVMQQDRKTS